MKNTLKVLIGILFFVALAACDGGKIVDILMVTDKGPIRLELYADKAPVTTENFLKYVDAGHYDGTSFYRVVRQDNQAQNDIKIEVIQGGLGMDEGAKLFPAILHETTEQTGVRHVAGAISLGRFEPGTAGSEFFITVTDQPELDYGGKRYPDGQGFAVFGKVTKGLSIVREIQRLPTDMPAGGEALEYTSGQMLLEPVKIISLRRLSE